MPMHARGLGGGWHSHFSFKYFLPAQREETGLGHQMAMPKRKVDVGDLQVLQAWGGALSGESGEACVPSPLWAPEPM